MYQLSHSAQCNVTNILQGSHILRLFHEPLGEWQGS